MEAIIIKSRYKVTQVLHVEPGYAALLAVDIESRDKAEYLLNVYEGALSKRYVSVYDSLKHCPEFTGMFLSGGELVAAFKYKRSQNIDDVFYKGAAVDWKARLHYAQLLFHLALTVSNYPYEIGCAAFLSRNLEVQIKDMKLAVNYIVSPIEGTSSRELICLLTDNIHKVLIRRFCMSADERNFLEDLDSGVYKSPVAIYSAWQGVMVKLTEEYEKVYAQGIISRAIHFTRAKLSKRRKKRK